MPRRACLALIVDSSLSEVRVVRELDRLAEFRGLPLMIVSDNGTELTSHAPTEFASRSEMDQNLNRLSL